jgi:hypothetical protein
VMASRRRASTAPMSPYLLAEGRPLHPWRSTTASLSPYLMAEGRPLHPWRFTTAPLSPYSLAVGRALQPDATAIIRPQAFFNLQSVSKRRLNSFVGVSSRFHAPSGSVPGGVEVGSGELYGGGSGAGPDGVFSYQSKVLSAKCTGRFIISPLFRALYVICTSSADK